MKRNWVASMLILAAAFLLVSGCANKYLTSGKIAYNSKNYEKAIHDFNLALEADSTIADAHLLLGKAYKEKNDYVAMRKHFDAAERLNPAYKNQIDMLSAEIWNNLFNSGNKNAKEDKWQDALKDFQTAIMVLPSKYEAYTNTGYVFQHLENNDSAYVYYVKAVNLDKTNVKVLSNLASITFNMKRFVESDSLYAAILAVDPKDAEALLRRGEIAHQDSNFDQAINFYNKSLEIDPKQSDVWYNLGLIYFEKNKRAQNDTDKNKEMDNAVQAFSKAVDNNPDDIDAFILLNATLVSLDRLDDAIARLVPFTEKHPENCAAWNLLSQAFLRMKEKDKALAADKKYKECELSQPNK